MFVPSSSSNSASQSGLWNVGFPAGGGALSNSQCCVCVLMLKHGSSGVTVLRDVFSHKVVKLMEQFHFLRAAELLSLRGSGESLQLPAATVAGRRFVLPTHTETFWSCDP